MQTAWEPHSAGSATFVRGGMGALTRAMAEAARQAGAEIRIGADVAQVTVTNGAATGVVLTTGEEIGAAAVVSGADPRRTFLGLLDPVELDPDFILKIRNYRSKGTAAKVNLALAALPDFPALGPISPTDRARHLSGRIHIGPGIDYLEHAFDAAKYGEYSQQPYLDVTIPSLTDPSMAPAGRHVMSIYVQYAPFTLRNGNWSDSREALGDTVIKTLATYAPGIEQLIMHRQVITPQDLDDKYGLTGGHIFHGEHALDQVFTMRPLLGWAQYRTPIKRLYLCSAGTHPGGGVTGGPGANAAREILKDLR